MIAFRFALALLLAAGAAVAEPLRFSIPEGGVLNEFYRDGPVAAHLVLNPGPAPRIVFAFPAGNSGAAIWFEAGGAPISWKPDVPIAPAASEAAGGLRGVSAVVSATGGPVSILLALTGSIRSIRDIDYGGKPPPEIAMTPRISGRTVGWQRRRIDGGPGYSLSVEVERGRLVADGTPGIELHPDAQGELRLRVTALTGEEPLSPLPAGELVTDAAAPDLRLRQILSYLSYREKLLAGSWRFDTYFGRDTLMSLALLAPVAEPGLVEAGLGAVLERLNAAGEVAHEELIGEYALLGRGPPLDYKMIDDDFMLAPVAAQLLLGPRMDRARVAAFLARDRAGGGTNGDALVRNLRFVTAAAAPFARKPGWRRLISLKAGESVGNWRDSNAGLGGGRYPYDVNAVLVPAALEAAGSLRASGLLQPYLDAAGDAALSRAAAMARTWRRSAPAMFEVAFPAADARSEIAAYARRIGIDAAPALAVLGHEPIRFRAVALDAEGRPVPVQNSDEAMALFFLDPPPREAARIAVSLTQPFPAGLMTGVGLVVANPAYGAESIEPEFGRDRYHGTVIWSWQQALLSAGIDRQLARRDVTGPDREALRAARMRLRTAIESAADLRGSELWSWSAKDGDWRAVPFGRQQGHETESNAAQLWSTVHLAVRTSGASKPPSPGGD